MVLKRFLRRFSQKGTVLGPAQPRGSLGSRTILNEDVKALSDEEVVIEHNQAKGERQHIVACPDLQELADGPL